MIKSIRIFFTIMAFTCVSLAQDMDDIIQHFESTEAVQEVALGGAAMYETVVRLRTVTEVPICFESLEYDINDGSDVLTLGEAIKRLYELQKEGELNYPDSRRLARYQQQLEQGNFDSEDMVGLDKKTFRIVAENLTLRELLDKLVLADRDYHWYNSGTTNQPRIIIEPKDYSILNSTVPPLCKSRKITRLYYKDGYINRMLANQDITLIKGIPVSDHFVDLCKQGQTLRDVLLKTLNKLNNSLCWTLVGFKGIRTMTLDASQ